jgi:group I intron endonuclease
MSTPTTLYIITSLISGREYVGVTAQSVEKRWGQHCSDAFSAKKDRGNCPLHHAIRKYGPSKFVKIGLYTYPSRKEACDAECALIASLGLQETGYNATPGGDGGPVFLGRKHTKETLLRMSAVQKGKKKRPETVEKMAAAKRGVPQSKESNEKRSRTLSGRSLSKEHALKISSALKGHPVSESTRIKLREKLTGTTRVFSEKHKYNLKKACEARAARRAAEWAAEESPTFAGL